VGEREREREREKEKQRVLYNSENTDITNITLDHKKKI
jgi:hypothetical protein